MPKDIKVISVDGNTAWKTGTLTYTIGDQQGTCKVFRKEYNSDEEAFKVGETYSVDFEKKANTQGVEETWAKKVKAGGFKGGGGRAPDPARAQIDREKLDLDKEKQPLIMAQCLVKEAVQLAIQKSIIDPKSELNASLVMGFAIDLVNVVRETHAEIVKRF